MTKKELVDVICEAASLSKKDGAAVLETLISAISNALIKGDVVKLPKLGNLKVKKFKERWVRNPKTGEKMKVKAKKKIRFSAAKELKMKIK